MSSVIGKFDVPETIGAYVAIGADGAWEVLRELPETDAQALEVCVDLKKPAALYWLDATVIDADQLYTVNE